MTLEMVRKDGKGPKLRAMGVDTRNVAPFAVELAQQVAATNECVENQTVLQMTTFFGLLVVPEHRALWSFCGGPKLPGSVVFCVLL